MKRLGAILVFLCTSLARADVVHVTYQTLVNDSVTTIAETTLATGCEYETVPAPTKAGYIFTHWSSSESDPLVVRDVWGRALDSARFTLYQDVVFTAHYVTSSLDSDNDGIPDGWEYYWYGNLNQNAASDTDGDDFTFVQELANGTNPLFPNSMEAGGVSHSLSETLLYNPHNYAPIIMRSEPEGYFFASTTNYCVVGDLQRSLSMSVSKGFAVWTVNDIEQRDAFGRALDQVVVEPSTSQITEVVAHYVADEATRQSLYWYGNTTTSMESDTDGDGYTFAEEIANGTNPLFPDTIEAGGISHTLSGTFLYNPHNYAPYVVRSEPEGVLFATVTNYVVAGDIQRTIAPEIASGFAYWTIDGVEQRDAFGRALDQAVVTPDSARILDVVAHVVTDEATRQSLYWYGNTTTSMESDTDGDGYTFAEEIANGTNPLFPDARMPGGISWADSEALEANLQPFDAATGAVIDEQFKELFTSPFAGNAATSATFGTNTRPVTVDVDGDGLFDLVILYDGGYAIYLNKGTSGNPMFTRDDTISTNGLDLAQGSLTVLEGLTLDVSPTDAVSCAFGDVDQDGIADLLVSDIKGRIWFYKGQGENAYILQHKVWGGSHVGFAQGLSIALVDWDEDGDLDCVCGTADGKLMLLIDPRIGRPTNVQAIPGVDSVVLTWDPNGNSRVRGYGIYRATTKDGAFENLALATLPRYRDETEESGTYWYQVTSLVRFYRAGNSTPTESESLPTDAIRAEVGKVTLSVRDVATFAGQEAEVLICIDNSKGLSGKGLSLTLTYDPAVLTMKRVEKTGLSEDLDITTSSETAGTLTLSSIAGSVAAGAGKLFAVVFDAAESVVCTTTVSVIAAVMPSKYWGMAAHVELPVSGSVSIEAYNPPVPPEVSLVIGSTNVTEGTVFEVPVYLTTDMVLNRSATMFDLVYDAKVLTAVKTQFGEGFTGTGDDESGVFSVKGTPGEIPVGTNLLGTVCLKAANVEEQTFTMLTVTNSVTCSAAGVNSAEFGLTSAEIGIFPNTSESSEDNPEKYGYSLASFYLGNASGKTGETVEIPLWIRPWRDVTWEGFEARISYDARFVEPVGVEGLEGSFTWTAQDGVLTIRGTQGTLRARCWLLSAEIFKVLKIRFSLLEQYATTMTRIDFVKGADAICLQLLEGGRMYTPIRSGGTIAIRFVRPPDEPSVVGRYFRGDVDGDGRLTRRDLERMDELLWGAQPHGGRQYGEANGKPSRDEIRAGDYNGNGRLDNGDAQMMREDFRQKGIIR